MEGDAFVILVYELGRDLLVGDLVEYGQGARVGLPLQLLGGRLCDGLGRGS